MKKSFTAKPKLWKIMKICTIQGLMAMILCGLSMAHNNYAQLLDKKVTLSLKEVTLEEALKEIEVVTNIKIFYSIDQYKLEMNEQVSIEALGKTLREVLHELLTPYQIKYKVYEKEATIVLKKRSQSVPKDELNFNETTSFSEIQLSKVVVTGKVTDAVTHQPMAGVNVILKGTTAGTTTDTEGKFNIEADEDDVIVFSFIGYASFETKINGRSAVDVSLQEDVKSLNEVVVNAGYWEVKEKEQTGNISKITSADISKQPVSNPLQALQGRVPGLYIQQSNGVPGSNVTVRIRGQNSLGSGNDPLYVIDNVPFIPGNLSSTFTSANILGGAGISPLNSINPSDIESMEILKDADATAIYGSRGANGVILITTKKGKATTGGKPKIDLNVYTGASKVTRKMDMLNSFQYLAMRKEAFANDGVIPTSSNAVDLLTWDTTRHTDWQKQLIGGTAKTTSLQATVSGGSASTQFSFHGGYEKQGTVFPGDLDVNKISSRLTVSHASQDQRFKALFSTIYNINSSNLIGADLTNKALTLAPNAPEVYTADGKLNWENSTWQNPLAELENKYKNKINNLVANASLSYEVIKDLDISVSLGFNDISMSDKNFTPSTYYDPASGLTPSVAQSYHNKSGSQSWIIEPKINWIKKIGQGQLSLFAGSTFQERNSESLVQMGTGFTSDALIEDLGAAASVTVVDYNITKYRYDAIYGRVNYNYDGKYILNFTSRKDGSSRFGPGNQFANFGSIGAAWIFSKENFMETLSFLSFGKLRSSYGTSGNDQIGDYQYLSTYQSYSLYNGVGGLAPTRLFNPAFAWEVNKKYEIGLELGFMQDRILLTSSYYRNRSSNQLINYPLAMTTGFKSIQANLDATVQNTGIELGLNSVNVKQQFFSWTTSFNLTIPRNKLLSFPRLEGSSYANQYVIGEPLTISKRYQYVGVNPITGVHEVEDMNGDGVITGSDKLVPKNIGVHYYGGLNNTFSFQGFQLDIMFQYVKQTGVSYFGSNSLYPGSAFNQPTEILHNRWVNDGDAGKAVQRYTAGYNGEAVTAFNDHYTGSDAIIQDASFIRLKNIAFSYDVPEKWIKGMKSRLYVQGQNIATFSKFFGLDPENYNSGSLPPLRTFVAGLQLTF